MKNFKKVLGHKSSWVNVPHTTDDTFAQWRDVTRANIVNNVPQIDIRNVRT